MRCTFFTACLLVLLSVVQVQATTFYVAKAAQGGSNSNNCTQAQSISTPKLTIMGTGGQGGGLSCLTSGAGDILMIRVGSYAEAISAQAQSFPVGTSYTNAATIMGYTGEVATIAPTSVVSAVIELTTNTTLQYIKFQDLVVDGTNANYGIKFLNGAHHIRFTNVEVKNTAAGSPTGGQGIHMAPGNPTVEGAGAQSFAEFLNMKVHDNGDTGQYDHGFYIEVANVLIEGCEIYNNAAFGIQLYRGSSTLLPNNVTVRRNYIHNNSRLVGTLGVFRGGMVISGPNNIIEHNLIVNNGDEGVEIGFGTANGNRFYNNTIFGHATFSLHIRSGLTGNIIRNNLLYGPTTDNFTDSGSGTTKTNNLCSAAQAACQLNTATTPFVASGSSRWDLVAAPNAAIDAGVAISGYTSNANGLPDIGVYETFTFSSASILNVSPYKTMLINFTKNDPGTLLLASCTGFSARKNAASNAITSCSVTGSSQISLVLTNGYISTDAADFTYMTTGTTVTDSALIGNLTAQTQRLNAIAQTTATTSGLTGGGTIPVLTQSAFRFESYGGTEAVPDGMKTINTNLTVAPNTSFRVRIQVSNTVAPFLGSGYTVYAQKNGLGGYVAIPNGPCTSTGICFVSGTGNMPPELLAGTATTEQLAGSGTFDAGGVMLSMSEVPNVNLTTGEDTELLPVLAVGSGVSAGDYFDLHIVRPGGLVLDTYTYTPRIIIGGPNLGGGGYRAQFGGR